MMHGITRAGTIYAPQSIFDNLTIATDAKFNRTIAQDASKLIRLTLNDQDVWQNDEKKEGHSPAE